MPTKKDLAALLSETPQLPLRRGRGLRLSRAAKQARELAPEQSSPPEPPVAVGQVAVEPVAVAAASAAPPIAPDAVTATASGAAIDAAAPRDPEPLNPERDKRKLLLRKDLLKQCKRIGRAQDRKLYQVIESALEEYIQRHGEQE